MCGRYNIIANAKAIMDYFDVANSIIPPGSVKPRYNIAPSQSVPAIRQGMQGRELVLLQWGLIPSWSKEPKTKYSTINARADTVESKPAYRSAFKKRRVLIPATGFYEWHVGDSGKQPYYIGLKDKKLFAFAGLWERWEGESEHIIESCTIIVTDANQLVRPIHNRMPVILHEKDYDEWLNPEFNDTKKLTALLVPHKVAGMVAYPVSKRVNSPRNDDPACLDKIEIA